MNWVTTLQQLLLSVAPLLIAFALTYYVKDKTKREAALTKAALVAKYAQKAVEAAEDIWGSTKPGVEKLKLAVQIAQQMLEKVGIYLSKEELTVEVRSAFQESRYAQKK